MAIALEKILTISAQEYCDSVGKPLSHYSMVGLHCNTYDSILYNNLEKPTEDGRYSMPKLDPQGIKSFAEVIPNTVEVVVGYSRQIIAPARREVDADSFYVAHTGTGLILKKEESHCHFSD